MNNIKQTIKLHPVFCYHQDIVDICKPLQELQITCFSHAKVYNGKQFASISTNPAFSKNYILKQHYNADVHITEKDYPLMNCLLWDYLNVKGQAQVMLEDAALLGCHHIFTMIRPEIECVNYYHFGTDKYNPQINQFYLNHYDLLEQFIDYFNAALLQAPKLAVAHKIFFDIISPEERTKTEALIPLETLDTQRSRFLSALAKQKNHALPGHTFGSIHFTQREMDCIPMIVEGCTAKEIAEFMGLSHRTIEDYISTLKQKLNVRNKAKLITKLHSYLSQPSFKNP